MPHLLSQVVKLVNVLMLLIFRPLAVISEKIDDSLILAQELDNFFTEMLTPGDR